MPELTEQLFGAGWADLQLDQVRAFFDDAGEEGLTWEAKGGDFGAHIIRKAVCGFANSERGGLLILGVGGNARDGWRVEGMEIDDEEPELRVGRVLRSGVSPWPDHRIRAFDVNGGHVAVVEVEPVAVPPAVTSHGQVYERVSGETQPVKDPARLAALFARGQAAQSGAESSTSLWADELLTLERHDGQPSFGLAVAATAYRYDIGVRLFSPSFHEAAETAVTDLRALPHGFPAAFTRPLEAVYKQYSVYVRTEVPPGGGAEARLGVNGFWNGTCSAVWISTSDSKVPVESMLDHKVAAAWRQLVELVKELGGTGPARLALRVPSAPKLYGGPEGGLTAVIKRHVELRPPEKAELASVLREIRRAGGVRQDEPKPDAPQTEEDEGPPAAT